MHTVGGPENEHGAASSIHAFHLWQLQMDSGERPSFMVFLLSLCCWEELGRLEMIWYCLTRMLYFVVQIHFCRIVPFMVHCEQVNLRYTDENKRLISSKAFLEWTPFQRLLYMVPWPGFYRDAGQTPGEFLHASAASSLTSFNRILYPLQFFHELLFGCLWVSEHRLSSFPKKECLRPLAWGTLPSQSLLSSGRRAILGWCRWWCSFWIRFLEAA